MIVIVGIRRKKGSEIRKGHLKVNKDHIESRFRYQHWRRVPDAWISVLGRLVVGYVPNRTV